MSDTATTEDDDAPSSLFTTPTIDGTYDERNLHGRPKEKANTSSTSIDTVLLQGDDPRLRPAAVADASSTGIPSYPHRRWSLSDNQLTRRSSLWPRPVLSRTVPNVPADTIAIRIMECLRLRSIAVEPNDEDATAVCVTVDGCVWTIHVWKGPLVECLRTRGNTLSFHVAARAVLDAAEGLASGADTRQPWKVSPLEYPRLSRMQKQAELLRAPPKAATASWMGSWATSPDIVTAREGLERAKELLLRKDRVECRQLALESLVCYTDSYSVGQSVAQHVANYITTESSWASIRDEVVKYALQTEEDDRNEEASTAQARTLALHIIANLMTLTGASLIPDHQTLQEDLFAGAVRPVGTTTNRPGPHDATLAFAASSSDTVHIDPDQLERFCAAGRATHQVMAGQARKLYEQMTRAEREC